MAALDHSGIVGSVVWPHEADTQAFAERLAQALMALNPPADALIELHGHLGAGKTTLARHLLRALGVEGRIKSPTYAVVETYTLGGPPPLAVAHFDFYRFNDPEEWEEAGFRELFAAPGLKLVEWPELAGGRLPPPDLVLDIQTLPEAAGAEQAARRVSLSGHGAKGQALVEALA